MYTSRKSDTTRTSVAQKRTCSIQRTLSQTNWHSESKRGNKALRRIAQRSYAKLVCNPTALRGPCWVVCGSAFAPRSGARRGEARRGEAGAWGGVARLGDVGDHRLQRLLAIQVNDIKRLTCSGRRTLIGATRRTLIGATSTAAEAKRAANWQDRCTDYRV